jgi:hypothetical protein
MDYAPGSKAICIDTGASSCISKDKNDFISLKNIFKIRQSQALVAA